MARKTPLSLALTPKQERAPEISSPAETITIVASEKRANSNKGKYHLGGYYDHNVPEIEAFRILATRTRRSQQELLLEAVRDLVQKQEAEAKFGAHNTGER